MTRDIDEANDAPIGRGKIGEAKVNRDAPRPLFSVSISVDSG